MNSDLEQFYGRVKSLSYGRAEVELLFHVKSEMKVKNEAKILASLSGKIVSNRIKIIPGDIVRVAISAHNLKGDVIGTIVFREKESMEIIQSRFKSKS